VLLTPAANLPLVSLIPVMHLDVQISTQIFDKIRDDPTVIFRGLGENESGKKPEVKNPVTLFL
jgi:hypothetical protein